MALDIKQIKDLDAHASISLWEFFAIQWTGDWQKITAQQLIDFVNSNADIGYVWTKDVDETGLANDYILVYKTASWKYEVEAKPSSWSWSSTLVNIAKVDWELFTWLIGRYVVSDALTISNVKASLMTLPTTTSVKIDIRKNGTATTNSIFTSDTELEITTSQSATNWVYTVDKTAIDNWVVAEDDVLYIYVTQIWDVAWADLTLNIS